MSTFLRKIVFCVIGLLSGLAVWPITEAILVQQSRFPSYLVFTLTMGVVLGAVMGGFLGSSDGITLSVKPRIIPGIITGTLVGIAGGGIGFLIGQGALLFVSEMIFHSNKMLQSLGIPIARAIGWAFLGMFVGTVEGMRALSWNKIKVGMSGGIIGGLLGGITLEIIRSYFPDLILARLIGLLILGTLIGTFYGLAEKSFSQGIFKLLNGKLKGKEYLLVQKNIKIGRSEKAGIHLPDYKGVADIHASLSIKKNEIFISSSDNKNRVLVNEKKITEHQLKLEDVVQVGSAKFLFFYK